MDFNHSQIVVGFRLGKFGIDSEVLGKNKSLLVMCYDLVSMMTWHV